MLFIIWPGVLIEFHSEETLLPACARHATKSFAVVLSVRLEGLSEHNAAHVGSYVSTADIR